MAPACLEFMDLFHISIAFGSLIDLKRIFFALFRKFTSFVFAFGSINLFAISKFGHFIHYFYALFFYQNLPLIIPVGHQDFTSIKNF